MFRFLLFLFALSLTVPVQAQRRPKRANAPAPARVRSEIGQTAVVVDDTLSLLRKSPSLFAESVHRMQRGRQVTIRGVVEADGVKFYKVVVPPNNFGWVQSDAVFGSFRPDDETRLAKLVRATTGFDQLEVATQFLSLYPNSKLKPPILLMYGDALEQAAVRLTKDANSRLKRDEMAATAAPIHSYYLNFNLLDRYRKLGVIFLFNPAARAYHYNGASWNEIISKFPETSEAAEARKRIAGLKAQMEPSAAK